MNWSNSRYTDAICVTITILMVVLTLVFVNGEKLGLTRIISDSTADDTGDFSARDRDSSWSEAGSTVIDLDNLAQFKDNDAAYVYNGDLYLTAKGTYVLRGSLTNHQIIVQAKGKKLQVVLDNVSLSHDTLPPLQVVAADKVFVTLAAGSNNYISATNLLSDAAVAQDLDAALYADADLSLNGDGALTVASVGGMGIKSTDDLVVTGGLIIVTADRHGLRGKDSLRLGGGTLHITATGKGLKTAGRFIMSAGEVTINSTDDAVHSDDSVDISGGSLQISTSDDGIHADNVIKISGGTINIAQSYEGVEAQEIYVSGGDISVVATDDGFNASTGGGDDMFGPGGMGGGGSMGEGGERQFAGPREGTDGGRLRPEHMDFSDQSGNMGLPPEFAGNEAGAPPSSGDASLGFDFMPPGGAPPSGQPPAAAGQPTVADAAATSSTRGQLPLLLISGGRVRVNAAGDGLDSNGDLVITGGDIVVDGPTNNGNGALDSGTESGGDLRIEGGTILALGSSGMAEKFSDTSTQASFIVTFASNFAAGQTLQIIAAGSPASAPLYAYTIQKSGNSAVFSSPNLALGQTYTVTVGNQSQTITLDSISAGTSGGMGGGSFGGGRGSRL